MSDKEFKCNKKGACFARDKKTGKCKILATPYEDGKPCAFQKPYRDRKKGEG